MLESEIPRQLLPDGGFADRSPETLLHAYRHVVMVVDALKAIDHPIPGVLLSAHDRMPPMLRFFRHGDGALALFHGGRECDRHTIAGLLARDETRGASFLHAPHSQYQRLNAVKSYAVMDCGPIPEGVYANTAHAGCLSFEFSAGPQRLIVNCGASKKWDGMLRATAAHSTVTLADTSMASILSPGFARGLIGARMMGGPQEVTSNRRETSHGWCIEARHDGYARRFGIVHERRLILSPDGAALTGGDTLRPRAMRKAGAVAFAVRFHVHPDVRVTSAQEVSEFAGAAAGRDAVLAAAAKVGVNVESLAGKNGYAFYSSLQQMSPSDKRVVVLYPTGDFSVGDATSRAVHILSQNKRGYFLMVEWDMHTSNVESGLKHVIEMDNTIRQTAQSVGKDTLIIFTADHSFDIRLLRGKRGDPLLSKTAPASGSPAAPKVAVGDSHSGEQVLAAAMGPGAKRVRGFIRNTDLFHIMMAAYGWEKAR